jgi:hypothetical protein
MGSAATMANVGMGAQVAGGVSSAFAARNAASAQKKSLEYNATVAEQNARVVEWRAQDAVVRGQKAVAAQGLRTRQMSGRQRAGLAARGIALDEGSALNILADTDFMASIDAAQIADNSAMEVWALRREGQNFLTQATLDRASARQISPNRAMIGSLIGSAGNVANTWNRNAQAGIPGYGSRTTAAPTVSSWQP